jgi:flagellar M-ring protein FliF
MNAQAAAARGASGVAAGLRPLLLLVGIAAAVAAGVTVVLWAQGPSYSLLYANLATEETAEIARALESAGIPHRLEAASGAISVPSDRVNDARLRLAAQGLPQSDGGFATMAKEPGFGVSQFMESARYQHALEKELARTIASLQPVQAARVHIAMARQSAFVRDRRPPSASVIVQLKAGRRIETDQVAAIVNLVASAIPELESSHVTVVDSQGRLLSAPQRTDEAALREQQFEFAHRLEEGYTRRIEALLEPLVGVGRVRAQVVAQVEMSVTEEAREQYRPESQIVRSEQISEDLARANAGPQGVPGALSNQPPDRGVALPAGVAAPATNGATPASAATANAASTPENVSRAQTRNYEIDRTVAYTRQPAGRLKRLTVAVLIDNLRIAGQDGKTTEKALTAEQIERVTALVKDAVGFDAARGDSVNVVNASFQGESAARELEPDAIPIWERPLVRDLAKLLVGLIVLLTLALAVLRPLVRGLLATPRPQLALAAAAPAAGAEVARAVASAGPVASGAPGGSIAYEQQVAQARGLVAQDPKRVAQVVRSWVATDE